MKGEKNGEDLASAPLDTANAKGHKEETLWRERHQVEAIIS